MNMVTKQNIFEEKKEEYWKADKKRKGEILHAVCEVSGLTRKRAIKRFRRLQLTPSWHQERRGRPRRYTPDVIAALREVWEMGSQPCGENLHPLIGEYLDIQVRAGTWLHGDEVTTKLREMSLGSVKQYVGGFMRTRRSFGGRGTTEKSSLLSRVPIRMDGWDEAEVGVVQIDTVAHCGDSVAGDFIYTVNAIDVATLWGSRRAQFNKGGEVTKESIKGMRSDSPFLWTELHPDSGREFINKNFLAYATQTNLQLTRSRPYHKNDNQFVEERNGHVVRRYVGWQRLDAPEAVLALNDVYDVLTPYLNHFVASRRIVSKERIGARWKVTRERIAKTPYQRICERDDVLHEVKDMLRREHETLNPRDMLLEIDRRMKRVLDLQKRYGVRR